MDDDALLHRARLLRLALFGLLLAAAAWSGVQLLRDLRHAVDVGWRWEQHDAEVASTAWEDEVELEVPQALLQRLPGVRQPEHILPHHEGNTRILVPRSAGAWLDVFETTTLALDPAGGGRAELADFGSLWLPAAGRLLFLGLLALAALGLRQLRWGEDLTWAGTVSPSSFMDGATRPASGLAADGWVPTAQSALRPGASASDEQALGEAREAHKAVVFWNIFLGLVALVTVPWAALNLHQEPLGASFTILAVLAVWGLAAYTGVQTFTRRVRHDAAGIRDASFFRIRRVPWAAIARLAYVNLAEDAQRRYDRQSKRSGSRPRDIWVWRIADAQGREILHWSASMAPAAAFAALRGRIEQQLVDTGLLQRHPAGAEEDEEGDELPFELPDFIKDEATSILDRRHRGLLLGLSAMVLPFALLAGYVTWRSLWFLLLAASVQGTVVEARREGVPSVVVAYVAAPGQAERRIESDGSDLYADIAVGARLPVYFDAADPEDARIGLFLELWIGPILLGGLFLLVLLCAVLIARGFTRPMPMPPGLRARLKQGASRTPRR